MKLDQWEDKQGGGKRSKISIVVENFQFLGGRDSGGNQQDEDVPGSTDVPRTQRQSRGPSQKPASEPITSPFGDEQKFTDDEIPFARAANIQQDV